MKCVMEGSDVKITVPAIQTSIIPSPLSLVDHVLWDDGSADAQVRIRARESSMKKSCV